MSGWCRCAIRVLRAVAPVLRRDDRADVVRRAGAADVGAHVRREVAAGARADRHVERDRDRQRPHRVGLRLLLPRDREHPLVHAGLHEARRHDAGGAADRAGGVHPQQRLADRAERVGQEQLGHHHALEEVRRLADHHGVDVVPADLRVGHRAVDRLAQQAGHRDVLAAWPCGASARCRAPRPAACSSLAFHDAHQVVLQRRPAGRVREHPAARRRPADLARPPRRCARARRRTSGCRRAPRRTA